MLIYNLTINIDKELEIEWMEWMKNTYLPDIMLTGLFLRFRILRILDIEPEITYSFQLLLQSEPDLQVFKEDFEEHFIGRIYEKYSPEKIIHFRTVLEEID